ncbi:efflux transporter outer membrane subunit [Acidocella sp.]|jgi:NodT family efflux transporter outer membrane factor (OMF) lipoprotein|uniref:efflux transporter outer membrane subunit n=1 Tax=Acidocella sp. TaxID=50710 RepID=UPI002F42D9B5
MLAAKIRWGSTPLLALLAGCSLAPNYVPPSLTTPVAYTNMGPWTPASPADVQSRGDWWLIYNDPALDQLETEVDARNPTLAIALSRYDQAQQFVTQAAAAEYPEIGVAGGASQIRQSAHRPLRVGGPDVYEDDFLAGSFSYELDLWGSVRNSVRAGKDEAQATKDDTASIQLSLEATLAAAYFNLRGLDAQEDLLTKTVAAYARALQLTQVQHSGGIVSGLDVGQAQTQYDTAKAQLTDVIAARALFQNEIASLVGVPAPLFSMPVNPALPGPPVIPVTAPSVLLERRPDIAAAERRAAEANAQIGVAKAAFFPTVSIDAAGGFEDDGGGVNLFNLSNSFWALGPSLALTVFDGGRRRAAVKIAIDNFDQASETYRATVLTAFEQVEDQLALCNDLAVEASQQNAAVTAADHTETLSLALYTQGAVTYLNVVTAQTADLGAQRTALMITTRRLVSSVDLVRALGGGWQT